MQLHQQDRKINVLVAIDHAGYRGKLAGVGRYLLNTLPVVNREQFKITLIILREMAALDVHLKDSGLQVLHLDRKKFDPFTLIDFVRIIRQEKIDVMHVHQYSTSNFGRVAAMITGVPIVLHIHGPDLNYPLYQKIADRLIAGAVDCALAVSASAKEECVHNRSISPERIIILPNGVPLDMFRPLSPAACRALKEQWLIRADSLVVGTVSRMHEEKGNRFLLEAAALVLHHVSSVRFVLVGEGPLFRELKAQARKLHIADNVIFTGFQDDVVGLLSIFDIMVLPSLVEGHPQTMLEAMAMGKAIVASAVGGVGETIDDGHDGYLVPPGDSYALAKKIMDLLEHEQQRARLGDTAYKRSRDFSVDVHVSRIEGVYRRLSSSRF